MKTKPHYLSSLDLRLHQHTSWEIALPLITMDVAQAVLLTNDRLERICEVGRGDIENKQISGIAHGLLAGDMVRLGYVAGKKNNKPDLLKLLPDSHIWLEVKTSTKRDWQGHLTHGQTPPPAGHIHLLADVDPATWLITNVYLLPDAVWETGGKNSPYVRLTKDSKARRFPIWSASGSRTASA